LNSVLKISEL